MNDALRSHGLALAATGRRVSPVNATLYPQVADSVDGQVYPLNWLPPDTVPDCSTSSVRSSLAGRSSCTPGTAEEEPRVADAPALARTSGPAGIRVQSRTPRASTYRPANGRSRREPRAAFARTRSCGSHVLSPPSAPGMAAVGEHVDREAARHAAGQAWTRPTLVGHTAKRG